MIDRVSLLATALGTKPADGLASPGTSRADDALADVAQRSFRLALLQALERKATPPAAAATPPPLPPASTPATTSTDPVTTPTSTAMAQASAAYASTTPTRISGDDERRIIERTAEHAGIDPDFLHALRRAENGGPGREFGVLSVPAPTYQDQARVAAESIRRSAARFTDRGGQVIDAATGRYTPEFVAFFSNRYAPVGAANDPRGLNRHHARNLLRLYTQAAGGGVA